MNFTPALWSNDEVCFIKAEVVYGSNPKCTSRLQFLALKEDSEASTLNTAKNKIWKKFCRRQVGKFYIKRLEIG